MVIFDDRGKTFEERATESELRAELARFAEEAKRRIMVE
jgi:hypothetical protein